MLKIGEDEIKISVTTREGAVRVHFSKLFQRNFGRKKIYPSRQSIALTVEEWTDLKAMITNVNEVVACSTFKLNEMKEEGEQGTRISYNRQLAVDEVDERNLQMFNDQVANEIIRLSKEKYEPQVKRDKLSPPVDELSCCANWSLEFQDERAKQDQNKFGSLLPECHDSNANFSFEFQEN